MKAFLTRRAERNYISILEYVTKEFATKTAATFVQKADETFKLLHTQTLEAMALSRSLCFHQNHGFQVRESLIICMNS